MKEKDLHKSVINYIKLQYPKVIFRSDYGAGIKLTIGQAMAQKKIQNGMAYPDLLLSEARGGYFGMYIELKKEGEILVNKKGELRTDHLKKQMECIYALRNKGYYAMFCVGFANAKELIDKYMSWENTQTIYF